MSTAIRVVLFLATVAAYVGAADWPQWRGPERSGVTSGGPPLANSWPKAGPVKLWESEFIPGGRAVGGFAGRFRHCGEVGIGLAL